MTRETDQIQGRSALAAFAPQALLGRIGQPEKTANVVAFPASEQRSYLTGRTATVDGSVMWSLRTGRRRCAAR